MQEPGEQPTQRLPQPGYEEVLVQALELLESQGSAGVERLLAAHPVHATRLRSHLSRLHGFGLLGAGTDAEPGELPSGEKPRPFPERLGDFRLLRRLGGGGMGVVFLAEQESLGRTVALKLVRSEHLFFEGSRERFRREVDAIARLQHPGIVPVHAAGEDAGVPWLAMEHVRGASLDAVLHELAGRDPATLRGSDLRAAVLAAMAKVDPAATEPHDGGTTSSSAPSSTTSSSGSHAPLFQGPWLTTCLRLAQGVAEALQHAHDRGLLHRDVKPSNIMVTPDGRALLLDFGLAVANDSQLGTPAYMSPEQTRGEQRTLDARTDVYSLGITLYELLALQMPFAAPSAATTRELVLAGRLPNLRERNRAVPRDLELVAGQEQFVTLEVVPATLRRFHVTMPWPEDWQRCEFAVRDQAGALLARDLATSAGVGIAPHRWHVTLPFGQFTLEAVLDGTRRTWPIDLRDGPDKGWAVLADPEGNEFCVLRRHQAKPA